MWWCGLHTNITRRCLDDVFNMRFCKVFGCPKTPRLREHRRNGTPRYRAFCEYHRNMSKEAHNQAEGWEEEFEKQFYDEGREVITAIKFEQNQTKIIKVRGEELKDFFRIKITLARQSAFEEGRLAGLEEADRLVTSELMSVLGGKEETYVSIGKVQALKKVRESLKSLMPIRAEEE